LGGTLGAALFHGLALAEGASPGIKGGWIGKVIPFHSEMGQNFWMAIIAWTSCFLLTIVISLLTRKNKTDEQLAGLVYSLTPRPKTESEPWYKRPVLVGAFVLLGTLLLNLVFW